MGSGERPRRTSGVIFDLDGTLADTLDDITEAMNRILAGIDQPPVPRERMRLLIGEGLSTLMQRATGIEDENVIADLVERYRPVYSEIMLDKTRLYPGVADALDALTAAGVPIAVLSNKPDHFTVPICERLLADWPFVRFAGHREPCPRKPDPTAALDLCARMDRSPAETFLVGDSDVDIETGRNAGMTSVAVTWGFRDLDHLVSARPAHVVDRPEQLIALIAGNG